MFRSLLAAFILTLSLVARAEPPPEPVAPGSIWPRISAGMRLQQHVRPEVDRYARQLASRPVQLSAWLAQARPFLWHVVEAVEARGMPAEIVLLPAIESGYNPLATSPNDAAGLWQFVPGTGRKFGLKSTAWYDGRRDPVASTRAALEYLLYLQDQFDNWLLTLAAYNVGENRIIAEVRAAKKRSFWDLTLPAETTSHVPRLLALAAIVRDPAAYGVRLPDIPDAPATQRVTLPGQIDLQLASDWSGTDLAELRRCNPALKLGATDPAGPHSLLVPVAGVERLRAAADAAGAERLMMAGTSPPAPKGRVEGLTKVAHVMPAGARKHAHRIVFGDTLSHLAQRFNVTTRQLATWNNMEASQSLAIGKQLTIWLPPES